jgi:HAD superfamily hydrolase (TIGR01484 family)
MNNVKIDDNYMKDLSFYKNYELKKKIKYVFTDVDDTITLDGKLTVEALGALWKLDDAGIKTICVTGGSTGWADIYLRQWPIEAVVSESGAIALFKRNGKYCRWTHPSIDSSTYENKRTNLIKAVMEEVPEARLSSDQFSRIYDVAFDHGTEEPKLNEYLINKIETICKSCGASTAVSSIHINAWFGEYNKKIGTLDFMSDIYEENLKTLIDCSVYIGDAPNDQVMFNTFSLSFAPANIYKKENELIHKPVYVAKRKGGLGFSQIIDEIIEKNKKNDKNLKKW